MSLQSSTPFQTSHGSNIRLLANHSHNPVPLGRQSAQVFLVVLAIMIRLSLGSANSLSCAPSSQPSPIFSFLVFYHKSCN